MTEKMTEMKDFTLTVTVSEVDDKTTKCTCSLEGRGSAERCLDMGIGACETIIKALCGIMAAGMQEEIGNKKIRRKAVASAFLKTMRDAIFNEIDKEEEKENE